MVSIIALKQKVFCDTRKCLFRCWISKLWCSTRIYLRAAPFPNIYITDLPQTLNKTESYLYAGNTCNFYQDEDVEKIENVFNKEFSSLCEWSIDKKVFGDDKSNFSLLNEKLIKTKHNVEITLKNSTIL